MIRFEAIGQTVVKRTIRLNRTDECHTIGMNTVLNECVIEIAVEGRGLLLIAPLDITASKIVAVRKLSNFQGWLSAKLTRCSVGGVYRGNDFGHWNTPGGLNSGSSRTMISPDPMNGLGYGNVVDCDFSGAVLDGCRFINVDMHRVRLPEWPLVTFFNPSALSKDDLSVMRISDPLSYFFEILEGEDAQVSAVTVSAESEAKRGRFSVAEFRATLAKLPREVCCY